jgi:K+-sensing histidine kinase KdpD
MNFAERGTPSWLEFVFGFVAGIGAVLGMWVLSVFVLGVVGPKTFSGIHAFAAIWGILSVFLFGYVFLRTRDSHPSVFRAGLLTAFALFLLMDAACWNLHIG